jgi:cellulose synthase/poly-beta-1,6-N-acetylglucosamine synthase-like glycosyltransferase
MLIFIIILLSLLILLQLRSVFTLLVAVAGRTKAQQDTVTLQPEEWPAVLIQIPVYNEGWEVKDAALAAMKQQYPAAKLCIQIIDDSTDRFPDLVDFLSEAAAAAGTAFQYLNRPDRTGYKSGALNYGMQHSDAAYIVVLDADFVMLPDFLQKTIPVAVQKNMAGVQTRWSYRNQFATPVVAIQSTIFEIIFALEQSVRSKMNIPAFFTGTSAVWNRKAIEQAGGWREKPFTAEDIDLSFRSYHLGYQFAYTDEALSSCEATPNFIAFKRQQQRWARGVFQAGVHNLSGVLTAPQRLKSKVLEVSTILYNLLPLLLLLFSVSTSLYVAFGFSRTPLWIAGVWAAGLLLIAGPVSLSVSYAVKKYHRLSLNDSLKLLTGSLLGIMLAWPILSGIWEVITRSGKEFVVTPKGNNVFAGARKKKKSIIPVLLPELIVGLYFGTFLFLFAGSHPEVIVLFSILSISGFAAFITSVKAKINYK